ncbi:hypothetical protein [Amycolatopsis orientalis]|uniref:hypothetical protein n=1 Tax=Amycolatopsis orientalis TaxID=31958 RepID=UPI00039B8C62|nr:hypothetical protein [Amycolatopsis orientalis]
MTDHKLMYRGVEIPSWLSPLKSNASPATLQVFAAGVNAALDKSTEAAPAYRYFHDGDDPGHRFYYRVAADGKIENWYENRKPLEWRDATEFRRLEELTDTDGYTEVRADQVPARVRNG